MILHPLGYDRHGRVVSSDAIVPLFTLLELAHLLAVLASLRQIKNEAASVDPYIADGCLECTSGRDSSTIHLAGGSPGAFARWRNPEFVVSLNRRPRGVPAHATSPCFQLFPFDFTLRELIQSSV